MAKKPQPLDLIRFWPIAVVAFGAVAGYIRLQGSVAQAEDKIEKVETKQAADSTAYAQMQVSQAKVEAKLESTAETLSDIKQLVKDLAKK